MKKLFLILIAIALMLFFTCSASAASFKENEDGNANKVTGFGFEKKIASLKPVFYMDFEKYSETADSVLDFDKCVGTACFPENAPGYGTYFSSVSNSSFLAFKSLKEPLLNGTYLMSFDFKKTENEGTFYIRHTLSESDARTVDNLYETFTCKENSMGYYTGSHGWTIGNPLNIKVGSWYHVMMWMDFDTGTVQYYINNEFRGSTSMPKSAYGFWLYNQSATGTNISSIDNFLLVKMNPVLANEIAALGINVPTKEKNVLSLKITSKMNGNIFTDFNNLDFKTEYINTSSESVTYDVKYSVKDFKGDVVWRGEKKDLKLEAGESFIDNITPVVRKFDIYTLKIELVPGTEKFTPSENDFEFSVVCAPSREFSSEKFGSCIHISKGSSEWDKIKNIIDISGIGWLRDDAAWSYYEPERGKYGFQGERKERMDQFYTEASQRGIKIIAILGMVNPVYGARNREAFTAEQLKAYEEYTAHFAAEYKGRVDYFEVGNEVNFARQEIMSCKDYVALLQAAYKGIKRGNPNAVVISTGTSRACPDWTKRMLEEGGKGYLDAVAMHPYQEAGTPESKNWDDYCKEVRDAMDAAGCKDIPLWTTEGNTSCSNSYNTEQQHGVNLVRQLAQCDAYNVSDKYIWYQIQTPEENVQDNEHWFGILHGKDVKNAYGAKQAYLAVTNYFAKTENAKFVDDIHYDNVWLLRFKKANGNYMVMMYSNRECKTVSLGLGALSGTLSDINGNSEIIHSSDGKYTFAISDQPIYFEFAGNEFTRCEDKVSVKDKMFELTKGSTAVFEMTVPEGAVVKASARNNLVVAVEQTGRDVKVEVTVKEIPTLSAYTEYRQNFGTQLFRDFIDVIVEQGGNTCAYIPLPIEYVKFQADVTMTVQPFDNANQKYWKGIVEVRNNNSQKPISGTIIIKTPEVLAKGFHPIEVNNIGAGEKKIYTFNIPPELIGSSNYFSGLLTLDDGEGIQFSLGDLPRSYGYKQNGGTNIKYLKKSKEKVPVIDGVIDADEWKNYKITDFDKSQVSYGSTGVVIAGVAESSSFGKNADYGGKADFSGSIFAQWDENYLYYAAIVNDDVHWAKQDPVRFYYDDVFYIMTCPTVTQRHDTRIDLALSDFFNDGKGRLYRNWSEMFDVPVGGVLPESEDGVQVKVVRNKTVTLYEARIPWSEVVSKETLKRKNFELSFNIRDYDGDRDKSFSYGGWYCLVDQRN